MPHKHEAEKLAKRYFNNPEVLKVKAREYAEKNNLDIPAFTRLVVSFAKKFGRSFRGKS